MRIRQYYYEANGAFRVKVNFTCLYCGEDNTDEDQWVHYKGISNPSMFGPTNRQKVQAEKSAVVDAAKAINSVKNNEFQKYHFDCKCSKCGAAPLWAKRPVMSKVAYYATAFGISLLAILLLSFLFTAGRANFDGRIVLTFIIMSGVLCIPGLLYLRRLILFKKDIKTLDPKYYPTISFAEKMDD